MTRNRELQNPAAAISAGQACGAIHSGGPVAARLPDGRLHLQHGPIDLVIGLDGEPAEVRRAAAQASAAFTPVLNALVGELPVLRCRMGEIPPRTIHPIAVAMAQAVWPYRERFITPMAAVAGSVAQYVLERALAGCRLRRASVNNGGDIALWLAEGESFSLGVVAQLDAPTIDRRIEVTAASMVRGIATSGRGGRSFSLGIADAVTIFAAAAPAADAAATVIANAVNVDHPGVCRVPANALDPDSDLGGLPVTRAVDIAEESVLRAALDAGVKEAERWIQEGTILGAELFLQGYSRSVGWPGTDRQNARRAAGVGPMHPMTTESGA